jgi:hypothetical protein
MGPLGAPGVERSLQTLVHVCHLNGKYDEEDAYASILSEIKSQSASGQSSRDTAQLNAQTLNSFQSPLSGFSLEGNQEGRQEENLWTDKLSLDRVSQDATTAVPSQSEFVSNSTRIAPPPPVRSIFTKEKKTSNNISKSIIEDIKYDDVNNMSSDPTKLPDLLSKRAIQLQLYETPRLGTALVDKQLVLAKSTTGLQLEQPASMHASLSLPAVPIVVDRLRHFTNRSLAPSGYDDTISPHHRYQYPIVLLPATEASGSDASSMTADTMRLPLVSTPIYDKEHRYPPVTSILTPIINMGPRRQVRVETQNIPLLSTGINVTLSQATEDAQIGG